MVTVVLALPGAAHAIPDPPCACSSFTTIGSPGNETNISSLTGGLAPNTCYFIRGTLVINIATVWSNVRLRMDEGSMIRLDESLLILQSYIEACDVMWKGIHVTSTENIGMFHSIIGNAEFGIKMEDRAGIACQYNEFINNYIGISAGDPFDEVQFDVQIEQKEPILGCKFYTDGTLPDPYPGQFYDPAWPADLTIPYNQGFAAIYIAGSVGLNIGRNNSVGADRNEIYHMRNGIILQSAVANITGTDIHDLRGGLPDTIPDTLLDLNQRGIHCERSSSDIYDNTITDVLIGIHSVGSRHSIRNNALEILETPNLSRTRGIRAIRPQSLSIISNTIENGWRGIEMDEVHNRFEVSKNILTRDIPGAINAGIFIVNQHFTGNQTGTIRQNQISITDGNGSLGIHLGNTEGLVVSDNIINYLIDEGHEYQNAGINCFGSSRNIIQRNQVNAHAEYIEIVNRGVAVSMSLNNTISCNEIENMGECIYFSGFSIETLVERNQLYDGNHGLYLFSPVFLGTQSHTGNQWLGEYAKYGAYIGGDNPELTADMSKFLVDSDDNDDFLPETIGPEQVDDGNWFRTLEGPLGYACIGNPPVPADVRADTLIKYLLAEAEFANYDEELQWMRKADIFELILIDPTLASNAVLDSFFTVESDNPLGKLVTWQRALNARYGMEESEKYPEEDAMGLLSAILMDIDSVLQLSPIDSADWITLRALKTDTLMIHYNRWLAYVDDEETASGSVYEDIADLLSGLTPGKDVETYLQYALSLKADHLLGSEFSGGELSDINDLAGMCPFEGARAVIVGHGLHASYFDSQILPDPAHCTYSAPLVTQTASPDPVKSSAANLSIYPNPGTDLIRVTMQEVILALYLYDTSGRLLRSAIPMHSSTQIDVTGLNAGIYFLTASTASGISTTRVTIAR